MKRLGHFSCLLVVLLNRLEFVAQIFLEHVFHVLSQICQPLIDVVGLRPDAAVDQQFVVVGQVHEPGEFFSQADRIDHGKTEPSGRQSDQQPQHDQLHQIDRPGLTFTAGANHHGSLFGKRQEDGYIEGRTLG